MTRGRAEDGTFTAKREPGEPLNREELAGMLSDCLKILHARATATRFQGKKSDPTLMAIIRAFTQAAVALNQLIRDDELEKLDERLAELEKACADAPRY